MLEVDFVTKALNLGKQAMEAEASGNKEQAYRLLDASIESFLAAIKCNRK